MNENIDKNIDTLQKNLKAMSFLIGHEPPEVVRSSLPVYIEASHSLLDEIRDILKRIEGRRDEF